MRNIPHFLKAASALALLSLPSLLSATVYNVRTDGAGGASTTITAALALATANGDIVRVTQAGTYAGFNIPGGRTLTIEKDSALAADSVIVDGAVATNASATQAISVTIDGINFYRSTAGNPITIEQYATPAITVSVTLNNVKITETGGECVRIDGSNPGTNASAVALTLNNCSLTATNASRAAIRLSSTAGGIGGTGGINFLTLNVNNSTLSSAVYRSFVNGGGNNQIIGITSSTVSSTTERGISDESSLGTTYNITDSKVSGATGGIRVVSTASTGLGQTWNIQRSSIRNTGAARPIDIGTGTIPTTPNTLNLYNTIVVGLNSEFSVSNSAGSTRAWNCTFVGEGVTPTNTAIVSSNNTAAASLDIRNCLIQNYSSIITPNSATNTSDYNYISVADSDAGPNRLLNTTLLTYNSTNFADPSHYKPLAPGSGASPFGGAETALVTGNAALLGTDRFGATRPLPALTAPDFGAVETVQALPEADITDGVSAVADGGSITTGVLAADFSGPAYTRTLTLTNSGGANLNIPLNAVTVTNSGTVAVGVPTNSAQAIAPTGTFSIVLTIPVNAEGTINSTIHVASDDLNENPYDITITGSVVGTPELDFFDGASPVANGGTVAVGVLPVGVTAYTRQLTATNNGTTTLNLSASGITVTNSGTVAVSVPTITAQAVAVGNSFNFDLTIPVTAEGTVNSTIHVASDDSNENPYDIVITGSVVGTPEFDLFDGASAVADGGTVAVGPLVVSGTPYTRSMTVTNSGTTFLNLAASGITVSNTGTVAVSVPTITAQAVAASGGTFNFDLTIPTNALGTVNAEVHVDSDDANEDPYDFFVTGSVVPPASVSDWSLLD